MYATVVDVTPASKDHYYGNVVLNIASNEELTTKYTTPGQYVSIRVVDSSFGPAYFFMASTPKAAASGSMEFLIHDQPETTAHKLLKSTPGTKVELSHPFGKGFDVNQLYPASEVDTVLLFASGYGLGPIRALIEAGFKANIRPYVRLYCFYPEPAQKPYTDNYIEWERSGVNVIPCQGKVPPLNIRDPLKTCAILCGSKKMQEEITKLLLEKGMPGEKILTVFPGYDNEAIKDSKVLKGAGYYPKFLEMGGEYVPFMLQF